MKIPVLFVRQDSVYKTLSNVDAYDIERNAKTFDGDSAVICHPPCRSWSRLKHMANPLPGEKELAFFAVDLIRKNGGCLEHPAFSTLWQAANLPLPGKRDSFGGWTLAFPQFWFGHPAVKHTWFYIVGIEPQDIPDIEFKLGKAEFTICGKNEAARKWRDSTPVNLAKWLVELVVRINLNKGKAFNESLEY